ncbi:MAG: single-stranded-DNA-specific exonuclease RecJ [Pseudomonadota bacterium]
MKIIQRPLPDKAVKSSEDLHPVLERVYRSRGVVSAKELDHSLSRLLPATQLKHLDEAASLLQQVLEQDGRFLIVGDYDCDGATSSVLAILALQAFGANNVSYLVPNRFEFGYGLTPEIVDLAVQQHPNLIITVDNGIASIAGVERANASGVPVLITDHHLPGDWLPPAAVIVNPNQPDDGFPSKHLAGVGVIFYVMAALRSRLRGNGWFERNARAVPNLAEWLDLVALGTVADLVPLDANNRILVEQGLRRIRAGRCRPGIQALLELAGRSLHRVVASDLGFAVGPRLNAAGRLEDMGLGIECLLTEDHQAASGMAQELDRLNRTRREIEQQMKEQAVSALERLHLESAGELPAGLCLYRPEWHQGVIGILAARIREQYHRPAIVFADGGAGMLKGSARSVPELHIRDLLDRIASQHSGLLDRFGGHAMAAGLSLREENFQAFRTAFEQAAGSQLDIDALEGSHTSDGSLSAEQLSLELAQQIRFAGPWGQGFAEPVFDDGFRVVHQRVVGERHLKLRLTAMDNNDIIDAIAFNQADLGRLPEQVHLVYRLDVNEFRGLLQPQLIVEAIQSTS